MSKRIIRELVSMARDSKATEREREAAREALKRVEGRLESMYTTSVMPAVSMAALMEVR